MKHAVLFLGILLALSAPLAHASDSACYEPNFSSSKGRDCDLLRAERLAVETELALVATRLSGKALEPDHEQQLVTTHGLLYGGSELAKYDLRALREARLPALRARQTELLDMARRLADCPVEWRPIRGSYGGKKRIIEPSRTCRAIRKSASAK